MFAIFTCVASIVVALLICWNADGIGRRLGVIDHPDNLRKTHAKKTPLVGGMAILLALLIWLCLMFASGEIADMRALVVLMLCSVGVGIVGFADDQAHMSPFSRIVLLCVYLAVALAVDPRLIAASLNWGSFGPMAISPWFYCALLALTTTGIVNAVNMADGQNGLVPGMFVIWSLSLLAVGDAVVAGAALVLALAAAVVLAFNLRGRLFLGDCGSYGVTFVLGLLAMMTYAQGRISIETVTIWFFVPVMDCLRLIVTRRLMGRSPVSGDNNHFHHRLKEKLGRDNGLAAYLLTVGASSLVSVLAPRFSLVCLVALTATYFCLTWLTDAPAAGSGQAENGNYPLFGVGRTNLAKAVSLAGSERLQSRKRA
jgi:UDP-GlcNAc:undecaprenyl-phosphate/decaprenyl-phosphate GlcNAc-1-phosphate transferase